ncbi:amino acid ABC transporter substrate-binding protein [Ureibacillus thermophilus]|uniref:Amino acid ABC transporter substrate-binding protein n=1 Tax=Ureibacillus thermophilus TaxID=367743 RepID=A0A4P6UWK6_9BACL|nr:amino acid ABC transporter substrate-binding protein [Ureibacillus thermophilus]QBK26438.1 amino acid ABC transporter substrate-binding protein [Ureibacillus thermophilus]
MKRKFTLLFLLAMVVMVLAACGSSSDDESSKSKDEGKEKEKLIIGIDDHFAPMGFRDENNEIVGFDIDMARAAAEKMGVEVEFQPIDWSTKESELSSGRIDLIWNGYTITEERKEKVLFTKPYLENAQVLVTLADSPITKIDELAGKQVGVQALSSALDALNKHPISKEVKLSEYKDNVLALQDLKNGRVDAVVIDKVVIEYYMTQETDTFKILEEELAPEQYGVGVKKGNEALLEKLQAALDEMNEDGTAAEISEKWFGEDRVLK